MVLRSSCKFRNYATFLNHMSLKKESWPLKLLENNIQDLKIKINSQISTNHMSNKSQEFT